MVVSMRILLVDDHQILLQGLRGMLENHPDYEVVGEASNGRIAVEMARELKPDAVLMDVAMPDLNGIEATRQIVNESPTTKVIALSMHEDPLFVREMLRAGASGYLLKESAFDELIRALRAVASNQAFFSPAVARVVMGDYLDRVQGKEPPAQANGSRVFDVLSAREREVLQLIAEGNSTRDIAKQLFVSVKTVEGHRRLIMQKTGIKSVAELTRYAIREGLTKL
jgi:two-component system, NarL family, response regulator NreC